MPTTWTNCRPKFLLPPTAADGRFGLEAPIIMAAGTTTLYRRSRLSGSGSNDLACLRLEAAGQAMPTSPTIKVEWNVRRAIARRAEPLPR